MNRRQSPPRKSTTAVNTSAPGLLTWSRKPSNAARGRPITASRLPQGRKTVRPAVRRRLDVREREDFARQIDVETRPILLEFMGDERRGELERVSAQNPITYQLAD